MEEVEFRIKNNSAFCRISSEFPGMTILRWCSSAIDYIEIYGDSKKSDEVHTKLERMIADLRSSILNSERHEDGTSAAISCRCSVENSDIRLAEAMNLLWVAPARYEDGVETLRLISFSPDDTVKFYTSVSELGEATIIRKTRMEPDSLRKMYTISLNEMFREFSVRQLKFLRDAISMGLYSRPRKIMVEDLARARGVTKSTMQEHLNKARNKLMRSIEPYINLFLESNQIDQ